MTDLENLYNKVLTLKKNTGDWTRKTKVGQFFKIYIETSVRHSTRQALLSYFFLLRAFAVRIVFQSEFVVFTSQFLQDMAI